MPALVTPSPPHLPPAQRKYLDACCVYLWASTPVLTTICTFGVVLALNPGSGASAGAAGAQHRRVGTRMLCAK